MPRAARKCVDSRSPPAAGARKHVTGGLEVPRPGRWGDRPRSHEGDGSWALPPGTRIAESPGVEQTARDIPTSRSEGWSAQSGEGAGMKPSEVRRRILTEHAKLRGLLAELESLVQLVAKGHPEPAEALRERGIEFHDFFLDHLQLEDAILVTALREADAWGEERAALVAREHLEQREMMADMLVRLKDAQRQSGELAADLLELTVRIREDMEQEEQVLLDSRILRDDVVSIDMNSG